MRPALSVRKYAASTMVGAIFMSNTATRKQCFQAGVFGLPIEYESFVNNIRKRMPLFLFDYNQRKLFGVFEAASDGALNINRDAFHHAYPAQVRVSITWKCRPLCEDEFSSAIKENYYQPRKFYLDLSHEQVVRLLKLFDGNRVAHTIHSYQKNEILGTQDLSRRAPDKRSLTPNAPDGQSPLLNSDISEIVRRYSSHTSKHTVLPPSVEDTMMPVETEKFGAHEDQTEFPSQSEHLQPTRPHQLTGNRSYPLHHNYPHKVLSSGRIIQDSKEGAKSHSNQSYPSSHDFAPKNSISSGYVTPKNHMSMNSTPYMLPYPALPLENLQGNADYQEHCEICIRQRCRSARDEIHAYEHQPISEGKALPSAELSQQAITMHPNVPEFKGKTVSAVDQQKSGSAAYLSPSDFGINFQDDTSDPRQKHTVEAERNTIISQSSVFSRIQLPSQEAMGPTLNQLVSSVSQKAKEWSDENGPVVNGVSYMIREQSTGRPYFHSELNLSSKLELEIEAGESTEPQPPFLNFKRRSKTWNVDTNLGKEISGKVKRRKLVRPSFEENNAATCSETCKPETKHDNQLKVGGNHLDIDLNAPATVESDSIEKDNSIELFPSVLSNIQTEKLCEAGANRTNSSNGMDTTKEQVPSFDNAAPAKRVSVDIDISLGMFASAKSNGFEEARSNIPGEQ